MSTFDKDFYIANAPNFSASGLTPLEHYITEGWQLGIPTSPDGDSLIGEDVLLTVASLPSEVLASLLSNMNANDLRRFETETSLRIDTALTNYFDILQAMNPDEVGILVGEHPETLATMEAANLAYLDNGQVFDLSATMNELEDSIIANVVAGMNSDALAFIENLPAFDLGPRLDKLPDQILAESMTQWGDNRLDFFAQLPNFNMGERLDAMDSAFVSQALAPWNPAAILSLDQLSTSFDVEQHIFGNIDHFHNFDPGNMVGLLGGLSPDKLLEATSHLGVADLQFLDSADGFDLGAVLNAVDESLLGGMLYNWEGENLQFLGSLPSFDMGGRLQNMNEDFLALVLSNWEIDDLSTVAALPGFDALGRIGSMNDQLLASTMNGWNAETLQVINDHSTLDLGARLENFNPTLISTMTNWGEDELVAVGTTEEFQDIFTKLVPTPPGGFQIPPGYFLPPDFLPPDFGEIGPPPNDDGDASPGDDGGNTLANSLENLPEYADDFEVGIVGTTHGL